MKHKSHIQHLYLYIPDLEHDDFAFTQHFLTKISQEINDITKQYGWALKTIYLANSGKAISLLFLQKLLVLLIPIAKNIIQYSFEVNVNTINDDILSLLQSVEVNRLVWKVITFQQAVTNQVSLTIIKNSVKMGFTNFSLDLNYNIPKQTKKQLLCDLQQCIDLQAPHISFDNADNHANKQFKKIINNFLALHNYYNYEYYSYVKDSNNYSQSTIGYCLLHNYYGLGPNAVSYVTTNNGAQLITNSDDILYQKTIIFLDDKQHFINQLVQGLLLRSGIKVTINFKKNMIKNQQLITKLLDNGQIIIKNQQLFCTNVGWGLLNELIIDIITSNTM